MAIQSKRNKLQDTQGREQPLPCTIEPEQQEQVWLYGHAGHLHGLFGLFMKVFAGAGSVDNGRCWQLPKLELEDVVAPCFLIALPW